MDVEAPRPDLRRGFIVAAITCGFFIAMGLARGDPAWAIVFIAGFFASIAFFSTQAWNVNRELRRAELSSGERRLAHRAVRWGSPLPRGVDRERARAFATAHLRPVPLEKTFLAVMVGFAVLAIGIAVARAAAGDASLARGLLSTLAPAFFACLVLYRRRFRARAGAFLALPERVEPA